MSIRIKPQGSRTQSTRDMNTSDLSSSPILPWPKYEGVWHKYDGCMASSCNGVGGDNHRYGLLTPRHYFISTEGGIWGGLPGAIIDSCVGVWTFLANLLDFY